VHRRLAFLVALLLALAFAPARAALVGEPPLSDAQKSDLCASAVQKAEQQYGTPPGLLNAIAKAESGRRLPGAATLQPWPWTLNIDGEGLFFATRQQALGVLIKALAQGSSFTDVGCMQVDLQYHAKAFRTLDEALDPVANADFAARFLLSLYEATGGNWFAAVGYYHSRSPELARLYREHVTAVGLGLGIAPERPSRLRLQLAGGGTVVINVNRQPSRTYRHLSPCQVATILGPYLRSSAKPAACAVAGLEPPSHSHD
jgi:Transglycosylase SLT domain